MHDEFCCRSHGLRRLLQQVTLVAVLMDNLRPDSGRLRALNMTCRRSSRDHMNVPGMILPRFQDSDFCCLNASIVKSL
jgi:hypothetical protein